MDDNNMNTPNIVPLVKLLFMENLHNLFSHNVAFFITIFKVLSLFFRILSLFTILTANNSMVALKKPPLQGGKEATIGHIIKNYKYYCYKCQLFLRQSASVGNRPYSIAELQKI
jgi:hypothetical protein